MQTKRGQFDEHMDITDRLHIQGAVSRGATIHEGGVLVMEGAFAGPLYIEAGGGAVITGTFSSELHSEGLLMLAGVITESLPCDEGVVLVSPGTILTAGPRPARLLDDGRLEVIWEDHIDAVNIDARRERLRLTADGRFVRHAA
jgi:hypothetical protein